MDEEPKLAEWWQRERNRSFTKLECGLLGGLFTAILIILMLVIRARIG